MRRADGRWSLSGVGAGGDGSVPAPDVKVEETSMGTWRRFVYPSGLRFAEFRSHAEVLGYPFIHYTAGVDPTTGRRIVAKGFIAVGRRAVGFLALGQLAIGAIALGQAAAGIGVLGQAAFGVWTVGQLSIGYMFALGQLAVGQVAIGQLALGKMVLAQLGAGQHAWTMGNSDPVAVSYFKAMLKSLIHVFGV
jgi:hypothetical protein